MSTSSIRRTPAGCINASQKRRRSSASTRRPARRRSIRRRSGRTGKRRYRFNWTAPIALSPHNSRDRLHGRAGRLRSLNRGDTWQEISPDLTTNDPEKLKGNIEFGTLTSIAESPVTPGVIWAGSDDGKVQVTTAAARKDVTAKIAVAGGPPDYFVTRVFASPHKEGTAYVTKAGWHRDVYTPYVFRTDDFGDTWTAIGKGLPDGTVYAFARTGRTPTCCSWGRRWACSPR